MQLQWRSCRDSTCERELLGCLELHRMASLSSGQLKAVLYILMNIGSGTCIVFTNKLVLSVYRFHFVYALTLIHTVVTMVSPSLAFPEALLCPPCTHDT